MVIQLYSIWVAARKKSVYDGLRRVGGSDVVRQNGWLHKSVHYRTEHI